MTDKPEKSGSDDKADWSTAAIAGAAIGSAALAAALLFASRRKDKGAAVTPHPEEAPGTD